MTEKEQTLFDLFGFKANHVNYLINVSNKYKYIYFETPKVGCSTIKSTLQKLEVDDESKLPAWVHDKHLSPLLSPLALEKNFTEYLYDEYFKFSFVRNPYTRILSCYLDKTKGIEKDVILPKLGFKSTDNISFKDFLLAIKKQSYIEMDVHWLPQSILLSSGKITLDFIGRQEDFDNDFKKVLARITKNGSDSLYISNEIPHAVGANRKLQKYITEDIEKLIQEIYYDDFYLYGYSKDPFNTDSLPNLSTNIVNTLHRNDLVSIIIPCYNQAQYLEEAVNSAIKQTYPNIEIIIVNDGSTDHTEEVALSLQKKYPEVIKIITQANKGLSEARNTGIRASLGEYILPLDADDILDLRMIGQCMNVMIQNNADIVHGGLQCFGARHDIWPSKPFSENNILYENLPHQSSLYKKEVWAKTKGYKQNMKEGYEDWEFWINAYKHNFRFHYLPEILYYYRIKEESMYTESFKKDAYLKAKIIMNNPELYTIDCVQKAITSIEGTEELSNLYFYYDQNIPNDEEKWLAEISHNIKNSELEEKQILDIFDKKVGLCNIDILNKHMSIQELSNKMDVSFVLFFSPIRYEVKTLQNSDFAWDDNKGIVRAHGTLFPFVFKSEREDNELQHIASERLIKYQTKSSHKHTVQTNEKIMVSVCVMSYNLEKYIADALDSILMQKVNFKYNIVVGDDCSTDDTRQILQEYEAKYADRFTLLLHENNIGMLANFAATLKECHGKYIAILDGDDYWTDPLKLQKQVDFLESNKEYSMVFHNIELHDQTKDSTIIKPFNLEKNSREYTYDEILKTWSVGTCAVLCINSEQYRYIEKNLWFPVQDLPFYLCCASAGKIYYMAETTSVYRRLTTGSQNSEEFTNPQIHLTFVEYFKVLYNDFNNLLSKKTIEHVSASHYLWAAQKSKKNGNKKDYMKYLDLAMVCDPQYIYEKEIQPALTKADQKLDNLQNRYNLLMVSILNLIEIPTKTKPLQKISAYESLKKTYLQLLEVENEKKSKSNDFKITHKTNIGITPHEIIFLIPTCQKYMDKANAIRNTWAKQLPEYGFRYYFLKGNPELEQAQIINDVLYVPCEDNYESLLLKLVLGYEFLYQNMNFTFIYKIDDDCYPNLEKLINILLPQFNNKKYIGGAIHPKGGKMSNNWHFGKCNNPKFDCPYKFDVAPFEFAKGGYGYFLRKDILPMLFELKDKLSSELEKYIYSPEDVRITEILKNNGILVDHVDNYSIISASNYNDSNQYLVYDIQNPELMQLIERDRLNEDKLLDLDNYIEIEKHDTTISFIVKSKTSNKKAAFYLYKNDKRIDIQWYSKEMSYILDKNTHTVGVYKVKYFLVDESDADPANSTKKEIGESETIYIG